MGAMCADDRDDDMQSLASLMSLQQKEHCTDSCDDMNTSDVANMADLADEDDMPTCQPVLTDIRQLVSRYPHKILYVICSQHMSISLLML